MHEFSASENEKKITELENRLREAEEQLEAIQRGEVDAFALKNGNLSEIYTLQTGDYAYRVLVENFNEGAVNLSEEGLIVYTNKYFHELLSLPYEKVIARNIADYIHPDSLAQFNILFSKALAGQAKGEINLMGLDVVIPVYISLTSLYPQLHTVGMIVTDLTAKKKNDEVLLKYKEDLEAKNQELQRSNAELASFSYIASHDLQEPLRKLRTFSSRILELEEKNFSAITKDYFNRIMNASAQMQNLIAAWLSYSKAITTDLQFEETDLNEMVRDVMSSLDELIAEHNVQIEFSNLPTLPVIPLQFSQVFSNLIMNSIKYRRDNERPLIRISAGEDKAVVNGNDHHFHVIRHEDNGIGFEQQHAERIFELFQRLHPKSLYQGTGIGLAICKKIVENHNGFIKATGSPGIGSEFLIYIPANHQNGRMTGNSK
jgi:PAS domain S-box-containing protein